MAVVHEPLLFKYAWGSKIRNKTKTKHKLKPKIKRMEINQRNDRERLKSRTSNHKSIPINAVKLHCLIPSTQCLFARPSLIPTEHYWWSRGERIMNISLQYARTQLIVNSTQTRSSTIMIKVPKSILIQSANITCTSILHKHSNLSDPKLLHFHFAQTDIQWDKVHALSWTLQEHFPLIFSSGTEQTYHRQRVIPVIVNRSIFH